MSFINCQKHNLTKDFILCLEPDCYDRLVCETCFMVDQKHHNHQFIYIKYFIKGDHHEITKIFNQTYLEANKNEQTIQQFNKLLDLRFNKLIDKREEMLMLPIQQLINYYRLSYQKIKNELCQKSKLDQLRTVEQIQKNMEHFLKTDTNQQKMDEIVDMINSNNQIISVQKQLDQVSEQIDKYDQQMLSEIQQVINKYRDKQDRLFSCVVNNPQNMMQLYQCQHTININNIKSLSSYKSQIEQYQNENKQFKIYIDFNNINEISYKKQVVDLIDQLNANQRVASVNYRIINIDQNNNELIVRMINQYTNLYDISIHDYLSQIDNGIHDLLKKLVRQRKLLSFGLSFYNSLKQNNDGFDLLKQYNQIVIKDKNHLECLGYTHNKISKNETSKEQIEQMINSVIEM